MEPTYSVAELSRAIARAVVRALPDQVWVEGEIRDLSRSRRGHVYFTLVDPEERADVAAALPVTLFASDRDAVNRVLMRSGAMRMTDGVHVRIRGQVSHYAPRSVVQLRMTWIDTDYTVGRLAAARRALLQKLEASGTLQRNSALPMPALPLRIGLVTSVGSAAYADFVSELERSGYGFAVMVADARVQGAEAEASLVAGVRAVSEAGIDVIAVVRGGGAQTDLACFDSEAVALAIAAAPVPVLTGIGHEVDTTVADHAASVILKTPTACAQYLVAAVGEAIAAVGAGQERLAVAALAALARNEAATVTARRRTAAGVRIHLARTDAALDRTVSGVARLAIGAPQRAQSRLSLLGRRTGASVGKALAVESSRLGESRHRLRRGAGHAVATSEARLDAWEALAGAHAPERLLARGWSVTYGADGRIVRSPTAVDVGDRLRTRVAGGDIVSTVEEASEVPAP